MPVSGILAVCRPENLPAVRQALSLRDWAEIHYSRPDGRLVVTVEGDSTDSVMDRVLEIQGLPGVLFAEMAEHHVEDDTFGGTVHRAAGEADPRNPIGTGEAI